MPRRAGLPLVLISRALQELAGRLREQRERLLLEPNLRLPTWVLKARQAHYKVRSESIIARMRLNRSTHVRTRTWPSNGRQSPGNNAKQERTRRYMSDGHWHARMSFGSYSNRCLLMGAFSVHASSARQSAASSTPAPALVVHCALARTVTFCECMMALLTRGDSSAGAAVGSRAARGNGGRADRSLPGGECP